MSRSTAPSVFLLFLLFLLMVQSINVTCAQPDSSQLPFDYPEVDGSAVDICRVFTVTTPEPRTRAATTTTKPITRKPVAATTTKPTVQSPPRRPQTKTAAAPIRPQPGPVGPITDRHLHSLLHYLLANSRRHAAGGQPARGQRSSDSDESMRAGRRQQETWKIRSFSSEDSSNES